MVHSFYSQAQPSGENRVVEDQVEALESGGHHVRLIRRDTDELQSGSYGVKTALSMLTGTGADPTSEIRSFRPDVVHIQNLHPNFSIKWCRSIRLPTVLSLHNYRAFCSNGLLYRDGSICLECPQHGDERAVRHACYRDSRLATVPVAFSRGMFRREVLTSANAIVTTSELSDRVVRELGGQDLPTFVIPNFGPDGPVTNPSLTVPSRWIALGRFTPEKGFVELLEEWPPAEPLLLIGDGPEDRQVRAAAARVGVAVRRSVPREEMRAQLSASVGLVFPSRWFESDPQVVVEAMRLGIPIVALDVNAAAETIRRSGAGAVYGRDQTLVEALSQVSANRAEMSVAASDWYQNRWTKEAWLTGIEALYARISNPPMVSST